MSILELIPGFSFSSWFPLLNCPSAGLPLPSQLQRWVTTLVKKRSPRTSKTYDPEVVGFLVSLLLSAVGTIFGGEVRYSIFTGSSVVACSYCLQGLKNPSWISIPALFTKLRALVLHAVICCHRSLTPVFLIHLGGVEL